MSGAPQPFPARAASTRADPPGDRYRRAEMALWDHHGLHPSEHALELRSTGGRVRVVEVGSGPPVLFVPGTAGTGPVWASLLRELSGFRCLLLDRPGWGFSSPVDYSSRPYRSMVSAIVDDVAGALELETFDVVGASIGNVWALGAAATLTDQVGKVVLLGGGPLVSDVPPPRIIKLIASPLGAVMVRLPESPGRVRSILRANGHGPTLEAGIVPEEYVEWRVSLGRNTESMRHERDMIRSLLARGGWRPGLTFDGPELARITSPTLMFYGSADPVGSVEVWQRFAGSLPAGELRVLHGAGHIPWLDDPVSVARGVGGFLGG